MKRNYLIAIFAVVLAIAGFTAFRLAGRGPSEEASAPPTPSPDAASPLTRTNEEDSITIAVTPVSLAADPLEFEISMDTHAGSLDADLRTAALLKDASGKTYAPIAVEGDPPGGHHRSLIARFPKSESSGEITLILRGVGEVPERTFSWNP